MTYGIENLGPDLGQAQKWPGMGFDNYIQGLMRFFWERFSRENLRNPSTFLLHLGCKVCRHEHWFNLSNDEMFLWMYVFVEIDEIQRNNQY